MTENFNPQNVTFDQKLKDAFTRINTNIEGVDLDVDNASAAIASLVAAAPSDVTHAELASELSTALAPYLTSASGVDTTELATALGSYATTAAMNTALSAKQDAATAATDAELAALETALEAAIAVATSDETVQDKVGGMFDHANHTNITAVYNDAAGRVELAGSAGGGSGTVSGYVITNAEADKTLDADSSSLREVCNFIYTFATDLQTGTPLAGYTITNAEPDKTLDADASSVREVCNMLAALVGDLQT